MENNTQEPVVKINSGFPTQTVLIILAVVVGLVMIVGLVKNNVRHMPFDTLSGKIYLTLAQAGDNAPNLHEFNISNGRFSKLYDDDSSIRLTSKISHDGQKIAYLTAPLDRSSNFIYPSMEYWQLEVRDVQTGETKKLTDNNMLNKRMGDWSPNGQEIAYFAQTQYDAGDNTDMNVFFDTSKWSVMLINLEGEERMVAKGVNPLWSPDGKYIVYIGVDGIYTYNVETEESIKAIPTVNGGKVTSNTKLGLSSDGTLLAITAPEDNKLHIYKISSWELGVALLDREIYTEGKFTFWPVFSEDGRYVAYQKSDMAKFGVVPGNTELAVYDLLMNEEKILSSLDAYNFDMAFITDWRE